MNSAAIMQALAQAPVPHNLALSSPKYTFLGVKSHGETGWRLPQSAPLHLRQCRLGLR